MDVGIDQIVVPPFAELLDAQGGQAIEKLLLKPLRLRPEQALLRLIFIGQLGKLPKGILVLVLQATRFIFLLSFVLIFLLRGRLTPWGGPLSAQLRGIQRPGRITSWCFRP